jgi:3-hydroxybutyrate dehydrogenase
MAMSTVRLPQGELEKALAARPKHVFIAGASRGIGEATARLLGEERNYRLTLAARSYNRCLGVAMDIGTERANGLRMDLLDERSIDEAVVSAESRFGPIDVLILNAGINLPTAVDDLSVTARNAFKQVLYINVIGTFYLAQLVAQHMPQNGRILFVGSVMARMGGAGSAGYVASKHAILGLVRTMAHELGPRGIRVNAINPGWVDTQMANEVLTRMATERGVTLQQQTSEMLSGQPIKRMAKPQEVASYLKFLMGPGGDCVTGQGIDLSCGSVMI